MSYFPVILRKKDLHKHDGRSLWKYFLTDDEFNELKKSIQFAQSWDLDPRDAALYFAEWWKRNYNGGKPSKYEIFKSIGGNIQYNLNQKDFYKSAKKGAAMLGVKWIKRQNTLYFRTLLMQGGLPLKHMSENQSHYSNFLEAVLDEQPEKVEDFSFQTQITNKLPISSRIDIVYENCFEIVSSILNDENVYDELFNSNEVIKSIAGKLKVRKTGLVKRERISKPQNYWLLNLSKENPKIELRLGLSENFKAESLTNVLGIEVTEKSYQFFVNDEMVCVFRKMLSGDYKTVWSPHKKLEWNGDNQLVSCYVKVNNNKVQVKDFIQLVPKLTEPSLWTRFSDNEWRLVKGNNVNTEEAAILYPKDWNSEKTGDSVILYENSLNWLTFEGTVAVFNETEKRTYQSNVTSFDWTIVSQNPRWMESASMPVIQSKPKVIVYNEKNEIEYGNSYEIYIKLKEVGQTWQELSSINLLSTGCYEMKIVKGEAIAYDSFYNIGNLAINFSKQTIDSAELSISNNNFILKLDESPILSIEESNNSYELKLDLSQNKIPASIIASIKSGTSKSLFFKIIAPFIGMTLVNAEGEIINDGETISFNHLQGIRILSPANCNTIIKMTNDLRQGLTISKEINNEKEALISYKDELLRLFYLADALNHQNKVVIELRNGSERKKYFLKGFTHTIDVENQLEGEIKLYESDDELDLYAIPLNCKVSNMSLIPLLREEGIYKIPKVDFTQQFIIISSYEVNSQLMPRFVNRNEDFEGIDKNERIQVYHDKLEKESFHDEIWIELLAFYAICKEQNLPFSTFDQLRAISRSSKLSTKAFFFLGINELDINEYIQKTIPELEKDLGFCFHWANKDDWESSINEAIDFIGPQYFNNIIELFSKYMNENNLSQLTQYISNKKKIDSEGVYNSQINELRAILGERVLSELPDFKPNVVEKYNVPTRNPVEILIKCSIAVAESIDDIQKEFPIWGGDDHRDKIRRNIQYTQYLTPEFYNNIIFNVLSKTK